jgi:hypothetical protein
MTDAELEVIDLATGSSLGKFQLDLCKPMEYELDIGSYRFRVTYLKTGEVLYEDRDIVEGVNPALTFEFSAPPPPTGVYPMNDFGNTTKWLAGVLGTGEVIERTFDTVKIRNNKSGDAGWLTTINPIDITAQGILDVEIYVDRQAAITGLYIGDQEGSEAFAFWLDRDVAYGILAWCNGGVMVNVPDIVSPDVPASLRIRVDATISPPIVIWYYNGTEIFRREVTVEYLPSLKSKYIRIYAKATRGDRIVLGTTTFVSQYVPPPQHYLTIQATVGGVTNPEGGTYTYDEGSNVQVTAIASSGYVFDRWELDGVNIGSVNPTVVTMDTDHTLLAVFVEIPTHTLTIDSAPIQGIPFTIERVS